MTTRRKRTPREGEATAEGSLLSGFAKLADAVGPHGVPFTAVFMSNVVIVFVVFLLSSQYAGIWAVAVGFAVLELLLGVFMYLKKRPEPADG